MNISDTPQIIELTQLMAQKHNVAVSEALTATQIVILAKLVEVISRKEIDCGETE